MDPGSEVNEVLEDAAGMLAVFLLFAGLALAVAWWAADRALRPVRLLEEGLARIGRGELDQPLPPMAPARVPAGGARRSTAWPSR